MLYRQGDVLLKKIGTIPSDAEIVPACAGRLILAEGEATGHNHSVSARNAELMMVGLAMYLRVREEIDLLHQEHDTIILPAGDYQVVRQREYSPGEIRNVAD